MGGYPVLKKWLGYRHADRRGGKALTLGEFDALRSIVHRISAVLLLGEELNQAYEKAIAGSIMGG